MQEKEKTAEYTGTFIARLGDLGLGDPNGIPSVYANAEAAEIQQEVEEMLEQLVDPEDLTALACIDGRHTEKNADGSSAALRLRRVGGSASNLGVALNSGASIIDTFKPGSSLGNKIHAIDGFVEKTTGFERSAHLGGCGGANGEIVDQRAINENPAILSATKTFMEIPQVKLYLDTHYDADLAELVRVNAGQTADLLEEAGWNGQAYVDGVHDENPKAVEDLVVDHEDHDYHGHRESTLTIVIGDKTVGVDDAFVWNLKASKQIAEALAGQRGKDGYTQAIIAEIAKHMAVANRLPSDKTPILLLSAA